jgi:ATP-binding cassette subfamily B protein
MEVYRRTLYQPYSIHVVRSSSDVISGIINKVGSTVLGVVLPVLTLVSSSLLVLAIMLTLIAINATVALIAIVGFGLSYGLITTIFRRRLRANSLRIAREHSQMIRTLQEGLGGIRDVLLDGTQPIYCEAYRRSDRQLRRAQGSNVFLAQSPRFALESIGMVLIAALAFTLSRNAGGIAAGLPALGALALGAQRLLPAMQQAYASWATIAGNHASLVDTLDLLDQPIPDETLAPQPPPLRLQKAVSFRGIRFRYTVAGPWILDGLELDIPKGAKVGFVGQTGSGKSTALDIFMGLLTPTEGLVLVDGEALAGQRLRSWQRSIAHVPQSIFLADVSFAQNIAFGVPDRDIDMARVREAARQAQIAEFIEGRPGGYDGVVGERGIQLSGGQRQRIGIARALYRNGSVLVLDEATSALDNSTEQSVMEAIASLPGELTVLIIAHRLSTVSRCDFLVELDGGKITAVGTYRDLLERSPSFQRMALATNSNQTDPT